MPMLQEKNSYNVFDTRKPTKIESVLSPEQLVELQERVDAIFTEFKDILRNEQELQQLYDKWKSNKGNLPDKLHQKIVSWWDAGVKHRIDNDAEDDEFKKIRDMIKDGSTDFRLYAYTGIAPAANIFLQSFGMWENA